MKNSSKLTTISALLLVGGATSLMADSIESLLEANFTKLEATVPGKFGLNYRLRYEEFETPTRETAGVSHRVRYSYQTENYNGFTAMIEGETLSRIGDDADEIHFLDNAGDGTELNQLWVQYKHEDFGHIKVGQQVYALDDLRFIGHVGWRQNIQSFDAVTTEYTGFEDLSIKAFYLSQQHMVNGSHNDLDALGLNVSYDFDKALKLTGFLYNIEGADTTNRGQSNFTAGLRANGTFTASDIEFAYSASLAEQTEAGNIADYNASYYAGDLKGTLSGVSLGLGFEILEPGFKTPLATVHKFNGFADKFLPLAGLPNGLEDYYIYAGYKIPLGNGIAFKAIYHSFDSEDGAVSYGDEFDFVVSYKINKYTNVMAKYGDYSADSGAGGAGAGDKRMFTLDLNFIY